MQPKLAFLPESQRGGPSFLDTFEDGANGRRQRRPGSLPGPSPTANLVGVWKGDPLGSRRCGIPTFSQQKQCAAGVSPAEAAANRSLIGVVYENIGSVVQSKPDSNRGGDPGRANPDSSGSVSDGSGVDSGAAGGRRREKVRRRRAAAGSLNRPERRGRLPGRYPGPGASLRVLPLARSEEHTS